MRPPSPYRVLAREIESTDTVTLTLTPTGPPLPRWIPGQFMMVYAFGVGEVPISISGGTGDVVRHTIRDVGAVTHALAGAPVGTVLGLHGPYGQGWDLTGAKGRDLVVLAGGIGLAPLRPVVTGALADRDRFGQVAVLIGARTPADLIFTSEYGEWRGAGAQVLVTVDRARRGWSGAVGVVTTLLTRARFDATRTRGYVCGPEVMMRSTARDLGDRGVPPGEIRISLERNLRCGSGRCGHCQLGPWLLCRDGPVVDWQRAAPLLSVKEL